jgi:hypothetical protein
VDIADKAHMGDKSREAVPSGKHARVNENSYDPGCGTGGFLAQSYEHMNSQLGDTATDEQIESLKHRTFYGREKENLIVPVALANWCCTANAPFFVALNSSFSFEFQVSHAEKLRSPVLRRLPLAAVGSRLSHHDSRIQLKDGILRTGEPRAG